MTIVTNLNPLSVLDKLANRADGNDLLTSFREFWQELQATAELQSESVQQRRLIAIALEMAKKKGVAPEFLKNKSNAEIESYIQTLDSLAEKK